MNCFERLFEAQLTIGGHPILWREIVGNVFGFASAIGGMRRGCGPGRSASSATCCCSPVFFGVAFANPQHDDALRAGRPPGLLHHHQRLRLVALAADAQAHDAEARRPAVTPRWATWRERAAYVGVLGRPVWSSLQWLFSRSALARLRPGGTSGADAWIFVGSMVATYAMARGWNDFWLLDRGRPRRRAAAGALRLLPLGGAVRRVRRPRASTASSSGCRLSRSEASRRARARARPRCDGMSAAWRPSRAPWRRCARAGRCSSPTTRTARTRATSSSPRRRDRRVARLDDPAHLAAYLCAPDAGATARTGSGLPLMVADNQDPLRTAYTVTVDARDGVTHRHQRGRPRPHAAGAGGPGDRRRERPRPARARAAAARRARGRAGAGRPHRGAVDLCRLAGLAPVGAIGELVNDDGTMMRLPERARARRRARAADDRRIAAADRLAAAPRPRSRPASARAPVLPTRTASSRVGYRDLRDRRRARRAGRPASRDGPSAVWSGCTPSA